MASAALYGVGSLAALPLKNEMVTLWATISVSTYPRRACALCLRFVFNRRGMACDRGRTVGRPWRLCIPPIPNLSPACIERLLGGCWLMGRVL